MLVKVLGTEGFLQLKLIAPNFLDLNLPVRVQRVEVSGTGSFPSLPASSEALPLYIYYTIMASSELEKLGKKMMQIEAQLSKLAVEIKTLQSLQASIVDKNGILLEFSATGLGDETIIKFTIDPISLCPDGASCSIEKEKGTNHVIVNALEEGSSVCATMVSASSEKLVGEWSLPTLRDGPAEKEVSLIEESEEATSNVQEVVSLKVSYSCLKCKVISLFDPTILTPLQITALGLESLTEQIASKEKVIDDVTKERGAIKDERQRLLKEKSQSQQQQQQQQLQQQQQKGGGSSPTSALS